MMNEDKKGIILQCVEGMVLLDHSKIIMIVSFKHNCMIHLENETYHNYDGIGSLEERLKSYGFVRIHRSYLVNIRHIRKISNYVITLDTGTKLPVSRARYRAVKAAFSEIISLH